MMPSSQNQSNGSSAGMLMGPSIMKPPLPNKLPPPPPPPPKDLRPPTIAPPPPPLPPPPPRNTSQFSSQSNLSSIGQLGLGSGRSCGSATSSVSSGMILNTGQNAVSSNNFHSSNGSRCGSYQTSNGSHTQRIGRHGECRAPSISNSGSSAFHHHIDTQHNLNGAMSPTTHLMNASHNCISIHQHIPTENGQGSGCSASGHSDCCNNLKFQSQGTSNMTMNNMAIRIPHISSNGSATMPSSSHTTISRASLLTNECPESHLGNGSSDITKFNCCEKNSFPNRHHCHSMLQNYHHNHHHTNAPISHLHAVQLSSSSSVSSSVQPTDHNSAHCQGGQIFSVRCNNTQSNSNFAMQHGLATTAHCNSGNTNTSVSGIDKGDCEHRLVTLNTSDHHQHHHHQTIGNITSIAARQTMSTTSNSMALGQHSCDGCMHTSDGSGGACSQSMVIHNQDSNSNNRLSLMHHNQPGLITSQRQATIKCLESSPNGNEPALMAGSTAHTHNLSNSSTTTHTSNVAVRHHPQMLHQIKPALLSRGCRSNSSQHYGDTQYGLSSAASTSSAAASLSGYHQTSLFRDDSLAPLYLHHHNRIHQPLPPVPPPQLPTPPPPPHLSSIVNTARSQMASSSNQMCMDNTSQSSTTSGPPMIHNHHQHPNHVQTQQLQPAHMQPAPPPPPPPPPLSTSSSHSLVSTNQLFPPLPPRPISPNASSCSTQITTIRNSSPVTRVSSQAGTLAPLPSSDIPPPLPPFNPGSRTTHLMDNIHSSNNDSNRHCNDINNTNFTHSSNDVNQFVVSSNHDMTSPANQRSSVFVNPIAERRVETSNRQHYLKSEFEQPHRSDDSVCPKCNMKVIPAQEPACKAMNQIYHANCFTCSKCGRTLLGKTFYPVGDRVYCEEDFNYSSRTQSFEKCAACSQPIFNVILPAMGKSYHPKCFRCCICDQCLDNVPFTIDHKDKIYCVKDYHNIYSPKCAACGKTIAPIEGTGETVRVVSMNKDYHVDCYCCEDCGLQLTDEEPCRNYPLDNHLLCQRCHINRLSKMQAALSLG